MIRMRSPAICLLFGALLLSPPSLHGQQDDIGPTLEQVREAVSTAARDHPRLLTDASGFDELRSRTERDPTARELYATLYGQAEAMLDLEPVRHELTGRRLLTESRKALRRVLTMSLVHRISGEKRFLDGARRELLAASHFPDWNPSHFLDTAEMSLAVAIGYDWLHHALPAEERDQIRGALRTKGIEAWEEHGECFTATNNWGQVCTAGITAAALALLEDDPELATRVVHAAVTGVPRSMRASFAPDGTYPEGPGYWDYGTSFNVILIAELESVLGTDFGLTGMPGFDRTAEYINHATGPTGLYFNYADGGAGRGPLPALFWFAERFDRPDWLLLERRMLPRYLRSQATQEVSGASARLLPLALLWMGENDVEAENRMELDWVGRGEIPVSMHRTSWDGDALYVGLKGGFAAGPHGQMDAGSFVLDADGVRWAHDLGAENYNRIESLGMDLWNRSQESDRWRVFRNSNLSHNTLVIAGQPHDVQGHARVIAHEADGRSARTVLDLSEVYEGQAERVMRGVAILQGGEVVLSDHLQGVVEGPVRWGMVTRAEVEMRGPREAVLRQDGRRLTVRVIEPASAELRLFETADPPAEHDSPNPGTRMLGFEVGTAPVLDLMVRFTPGSGEQLATDPVELGPLQEW